MEKGMRVCILESKRLGNCSNCGISSIFKEVTLIGDNIPPIFEADPLEAPAVRIVAGNLPNTVKAVVDGMESIQGMCGPMFGGCWIYSSDSRFPGGEPIALHDRFE